MHWFGFLKILTELCILVTRRLEQKELMSAGAAKAQKDIYKQQLQRVHNAQEAYDNTPLDDDSLRIDPANRDR